MAELSALRANRIAPPPLEIVAAIECPVCVDPVGYDSFTRRFFCNDCGLRWDTDGVDVDYTFAGEWSG